MAINANAFRGSLRDGVNITDMSGTELFNTIKGRVIAYTRGNSLPVVVKEDVVKSGGIFGTKCPILILSHSDPSKKYFSIGIYVNNNQVYFPLLGESAENTKYNKKQYYLENGNYVKAAFINPDEFKLEQEMAWQQSVSECLDCVFSDED